MRRDLTDWAGRARPPRTAMHGRTVSLEPLDPEQHAACLFEALGNEVTGPWRFIPFGPFHDAQALGASLHEIAARNDWLIHAVLPKATGRAEGILGYLRQRPAHGSVELGTVMFGPALQRTPAASEGVYLMMRRAFDELGYRRFEWKCDSRNAASIRSAARYGFTFEGVFRQDQVVRGENRDTAWFSITDAEWLAVRAGFEAWLDPGNFDDTGRQRMTLEQARAGAV